MTMALVPEWQIMPPIDSSLVPLAPRPSIRQADSTSAVSASTVREEPVSGPVFGFAANPPLVGDNETHASEDMEEKTAYPKQSDTSSTDGKEPL